MIKKPIFELKPLIAVYSQHSQRVDLWSQRSCIMNCFSSRNMAPDLATVKKIPFTLSSERAFSVCLYDCRFAFSKKGMKKNYVNRSWGFNGLNGNCAQRKQSFKSISRLNPSFMLKVCQLCFKMPHYIVNRIKG